MTQKWDDIKQKQRPTEESERRLAEAREDVAGVLAEDRLGRGNEDE